MITSNKTNIIIGPPGTGKTYKLISILEELMAQGMKSDEIGFFTFTRKAASEARERVMKKFDLTEEKLPFFKTFHSMAFKQLHIDKNTVMGYSNYIDICHLLGLTISSQQINDEGGFEIVHTKGDRLFFLENLHRVTKKSLEEVWKMFPNDDIEFRELELLAKTYSDYKVTRAKVDFTDMILLYNMRGTAPGFKVLMIDEAQDLSPIQWDMANLIATTADKIVIAGDDDQAIYSWAGADVTQFQNLPGTTEVLNITYRLTPNVYKLAESISNRIKTRKPKAYLPSRSIPGNVNRHSTLETINMSDGTWFLLSRNIFLLPQYSKYCLDRGYLFDSKYGSPINPDASTAIKHWEMLRRGDSVTGAIAKIIYEFMEVKTRIRYGSKKAIATLDDATIVDIELLTKSFGLQTYAIWHEALNRLKPVEVQYFLAALKSGEKMMKEPRIRINTIHGVKGGEAQNIVLMPDMSKRTFEEYDKFPDDELRVWYVGVTRAIHSVYILEPQTPYFIEI